MDVAATSSALHSVVGWSPATRSIPFLNERGAGLEIASSLIHPVELPFLSGMLLMHFNLELRMVLQGFLHMKDGIYFLVPRCSAQFKAVVQGTCWTVGDDHVLNIMLGAAISNQTLEIASSSSYMWTFMLPQHQRWRRPRVRQSVSTSSSYELHCNVSGCRTFYSVQAAVHEEYAFLLFGTCRRRVRASLLRFLRFNGKEPPDLSSVMVHLDLQLNPLPHRHLPTRLLVEPLALRLARLREAMEECGCRYVESEFSTDPLAGSNCSLRHILHVYSVAFFTCAQLGIYVEGESCNHCNVIWYDI